MHRIAPILLIGGMLLLLTSLRAPASPALVSTPAPLAFLDPQSSAVLVEVSEQVTRLQKRRAEPARHPTPSRDPFSFGGEPAPPEPESGLDVAQLVEAAPPPVVLPRLVAIVVADETGQPVRRAFVAFAGTVIEVRPGDTVGRLVVQTVGATAIELRDSLLGTLHTVALR